LLFSQSHRPHPALPSFPTRRSSDLHRRFVSAHHPCPGLTRRRASLEMGTLRSAHPAAIDTTRHDVPAHERRHFAALAEHARALRSEEHTSELQSLRHLVCRLLLEKK